MADQLTGALNRGVPVMPSPSRYRGPIPLAATATESIEGANKRAFVAEADAPLAEAAGQKPAYETAR